MSTLSPRVVLVSRPSEYSSMLRVHATRGQAEFFLRSRGQSLDEIEARALLQEKAIQTAKDSIPPEWSFAHVLRDDLNRFLFSPKDIIVAIGQDGLVANLAKYLDGQPVVGITPDPARTEGVLTPYDVSSLRPLLPAVAHRDVAITARSMVQAKLDDGAVLTALNELFIGHSSHQSARYVIRHGNTSEAQSSSGVIVATGTGLTGWAKSIMTATKRQFRFAPDEPRAAYFAREPWPSRISGCKISAGEIGRKSRFSMLSRMNDGGVIFADGIEQDFLAFNWGVEVYVGIAEKRLNMVRAA